MVFDPIANMISVIKNGYLAKKSAVEIPFSLHKEKIVKVLEKEGFIESVDIKKDPKTDHKFLLVKLSYKDKKPVLTEIKQVSKPSRRTYVPFSKVPKVLGGLGFSIISTSQGVFSTSEVRKRHLGGEIICHVW